MAKKKRSSAWETKAKETSSGKKIVSINFRVPVEIRERLLKFKKSQIGPTKYGPTWSLTSTMLFLLDHSLTERGF